MADTSNLSQFLTDVADAIRTKKETTEPIAAEQFDQEILSIETGIDTSDATATADDIAKDKTAYVNGQKVTGTIRDITAGNMMAYNSSSVTQAGSGIAIDARAKVINNIIYRTNSYMRMLVNHSDIAECVGLTADKLVKGNTILGVEGAAETGATSTITLPKYMVYTPKDSASGFEKVNDAWVENYTGNISYDVYTQSKILCLVSEETEMTINYTGTGTGWYYACLICSTLDEQFPMYNPLVPTNDAKYVHKTLFNSTNYKSATYTIPAGVHTITVRGQQKDNYYNYTTAYTNQNKFTLSDTSTVELPFRGLYTQLPDYNDFDLLDVIVINNDLAIRNTDGWFILDDFCVDNNTVAETVSENLHEINSTTTLYHLQGNYFFTVDTSLDNYNSLTYYVLVNDELLKLTSFYNSNAYTEFYGYITDEYNERRLFDYLGSEYSFVTGNRRVWQSENDYAYVVNGNLNTHYTFIAGPMQVTTYDWNNPSTPGEVLTLEGCYLPMSVYEDCKVSDTLFEATSDFLEVIDMNGMSQYVTRIEVIISD